MKRYLITVDLEGVFGVVGEKNIGLTRSIADYPVAVANATEEINTAVKALFDCGANEVVVWDGHGGGNNIDFDKIDTRATKIDTRSLYCPQRFDNASLTEFCGAVFIGYHAREGTAGVLAHTYNSNANQYIKINGKQVGEFDLDSITLGHFGVAPIFASGDDIFISQVKAISPQTVTALTKTAQGRNSAIFRDKDEVLADIYNGVMRATKLSVPTVTIQFPLEFEIRYTRMEFAYEQLTKLKPQLPSLCYGEDTHTLKTTVNDINQLRLFF